MRMLNSFLAVPVIALIFHTAAIAGPIDDIQLPKSMTWSCWSQGSGSYNQAIAIGSAMKNRLGTNLQIIPAQTDLSRQLPLKDGRVGFSCSGSGTFLSQEGVADFAIPDWGPQPVRLFALNVAPIHAGVLVGGDTGIETMAGLKGKRVAFVTGTPSLNLLMEAYLSFGGLSWDDVQKTEVSGFKASVDGLMEGRVDAIILSAATAFAKQIETSSRGGHYLPLPHDDAEAWKRLRAVAPYVVEIKNSVGAIVPEQGFDGAGLPLPFMITYAGTDEGLVYNVTKALFELHDDYKDAVAAGFDGLAIEDQKLNYIIPYHEGAIRYFEEKGVWSPALQANNDRLVERQAVLKSAWDAFVSDAPAGDDFADAWLKARSAALTEAGFEPIY